jgi:hypothetical protein
MESDDEGLRLVDYIRDELGNRQIRIILRTGHPGYAPETEVIVRYDINDYLSKAELSASRLITSVVVALRAYRDVLNARATDGELPATQFPAAVPPLLGKLMQPLLNDNNLMIRRLQQFELNPLARDLLLELGAQHRRLSGLCLQLDPGPLREGPLPVRPRQLLDDLVRTLLPLARNQRRLLDYHLDEEMPSQLRLCRASTLQLWLTLLEYLMHAAPHADLVLTLAYQPDDNLLMLTVQGRAGIPSAASPAYDAYWRECGQGYCEHLTDALGGRLELLNPGPVSVLASCSSGATAVDPVLPG